MRKILINHLGYDTNDSKKAVYQGEKTDAAGKFTVYNLNGEEVFSGEAKERGEVARWNTGYYWTIDFSWLSVPGTYTIALETASGVVTSFPFEITNYLTTMRTINAAGYYFKAQRSTGECREENSHVCFKGEREGIMDVHGGWYDATGDYSVHMSHLSHGTVYNPQQSSFAGYAFFKAHEMLEASGNVQYSMIKRRMLDEGTHGADFVMRMRAPSGTFFRSVARSDALDQVRGTHFINFEYRGSSNQFSAASTADSEVITDENYEVSLRSGGGLCIATLAAASRYYYPGTDFTRDEYLLAAKDAWKYLEKNNCRYTSDGNWNLLDEYCALIALTELYRATYEYEYLDKAESMAEKIIARAEDMGGGMLRLNVQPGRPFHHASDEGMPVMALLEFAEIEPDNEKKLKAISCAEGVFKYHLHLSDNPFGYPKYCYLNRKGEIEEKFFFPHDTDVAPWWQGENARIASLAAAARMLGEVTNDSELKARLKAFSSDQISWILGMNPFDSCMMEGYGRNNVQYYFGGRYDFINCPGGICNGITSGLDDEEGIALCTEPCEEVRDNWRWAEQWLPHVSWFMLAQCAKKI